MINTQEMKRLINILEEKFQSNNFSNIVLFIRDMDDERIRIELIMKSYSMFSCFSVKFKKDNIFVSFDGKEYMNINDNIIPHFISSLIHNEKIVKRDIMEE